MGLGKQAKTLSKKQVDVMLMHLSTTRHQIRNKVIFLLSVKSGLRAKEIASLKWSMLTNPEGELVDTISLTNIAAKGDSGRVISLNKDLKSSLSDLLEVEKTRRGFDVHLDFVITTQRSNHTSPQAIVNLFQTWYSDMEFGGCSSHSGRRTFITNVARKISGVGGSMRDVQSLAGHSNLQTTQRYIEVDTDSQKRVVDLI